MADQEGISGMGGNRGGSGGQEWNESLEENTTNKAGSVRQTGGGGRL